MQKHYGIRPWELKDYRPAEIRQMMQDLDLREGGVSVEPEPLDMPSEAPRPVPSRGGRVVHGLRGFLHERTAP